MRFRFAAFAAFALALGLAAAAQDSTDPAPPPQAPGPGAGMGMGRGQGGGRGWGANMAGRGLMGTVTEVASDHYTIKTMTGETYTVHYSANTRFLQQPPQRTPAQGMNQGPGMRTPPQEIKSTDIRVGDAIAAGGEVDAAAKSVGAMSVIKIDPARAQQMREMQANFGKTWLMGKVTEISETKITLQSQVDNATHTFVADENTSFRRRREPVTLADVQVGANVRVEGAVKDGVFTASQVMVMAPPPAPGSPAEPPAAGEMAPRPGPPPQ